ncbi:MAG: hypothetical protein NTW87_25980 [Planctomycetota bacterium]|nr:hypothetical protein [Planctomycetota bacterium]
MKMCKSIVPALVLGLGLVCEKGWAASLGPAVFTVQNVVPGQSVDLRKTAGLVYTIGNTSDTEGTYSLVCQRPVEGGVLNWESGYDEIPDASWCKLEKEEVVVPAKSKAEVGLTITVPAKPEYHNCKWVAAVVLKASKTAGIGVGLAVAARVRIETAPSDDPGTGGAVSMAAIPCVLPVEAKPGSMFERCVLLRNNTERTLECVTQRLEDCYPEGESRYPRYTTSGYQALDKVTWLKDKEQKFTLKPGERREYKMKGQIPESAKPGEKREELVFITAPAPEPGKQGPAGRETRTFFRVRYDVTADGAK